MLLLHAGLKAVQRLAIDFQAQVALGCLNCLQPILVSQGMHTSMCVQDMWSSLHV